jgi:hypothetical protein
MTSNDQIVEIDNVVYVDDSGNEIDAVGGWFSKLKKSLSIKKIKKALTIKNVVGAVASIALPGAGSLIVNAAITASDIKKGQDNAKKIKQAAAAAAKKDATAIKKITESFNALKKQSTEFRAQYGLPPASIVLPDLKKATAAQIEKAFADVQADATAVAARAANPGNPVAATEAQVAAKMALESGSSSVSKTPYIVAGGAVLLLGAVYFATRKRR